MSNFPEFINLNLGIYVDNLVKWLIINADSVFNAISKGMLGFLLKIQDFLMWIPWFALILAIFLLGMYVKNWKSGLSFAVMLTLIGAMGLWQEMMLSLAIIITSVIISIIIGIPLGILSAKSKRISMIMSPLLDAMQTMPSFVYLIPAVMFFGLGMVPAVFATIIYATPPAIRLTNLAITGVDKEMLEAAHSFGASSMNVLFKVELPQAFPTIMTGINQTMMMAVSMVVIASMIGARGLGLNVLESINRLDIAKGFEAGLSVVFIAIILDRLTQGMANKMNYHSNDNERN
ncbi:MAG: ABC transporter permease subunit [Tissierellia bacterium]|jgi:glycine betaine/proline transport system permease protein|nr:ABC transporter permease subunit [Tissierellia bacterium]